MKMTQDDYAILKAEILEYVNLYPMEQFQKMFYEFEELYKTPEYAGRDVKMRIRWEVLHATDYKTGSYVWTLKKLKGYDTTNRAGYNDTHIDTALKKIFREIF